MFRDARRDIGRHDDRNVREARVLEHGSFEHRPGVVGPAVQIRTDLQRPVPQLHSSVNARRQQRSGQPIVSDDPRAQRRRGAGQEHDCFDCATACSTLTDRVRRQHHGNEDQIRSKLRRDAGEHAGDCEPRPSIREVRFHERGDGGHEQYRAHGVGRLCGCVHGVERKDADEHRCERGGALTDPFARRQERQQRNARVQRDLRDERNRRVIPEQPVERREEAGVAPRHVERRKTAAVREHERELMVMIESFPAPRMRRPDEHEEQADHQRHAARGVHDSNHRVASYRAVR